MNNRATLFNVFGEFFKFLRRCVSNIFKYLACCGDERIDDRMALRNLYNSGHIDEGKYHHCLNKCRNGSYDPDETQIPT